MSSLWRKIHVVEVGWILTLESLVLHLLSIKIRMVVVGDWILPGTLCGVHLLGLRSLRSMERLILAV